MKLSGRIRRYLTAVVRYRLWTVAIVSLSWTMLDLMYWIWYLLLPLALRDDTVFTFMTPAAVLLRAGLVLVMSVVMSYVLLFRLREVLRNYPLWLNLSVKTIILLLTSLVMNFLLYVLYALIILELPLQEALSAYLYKARNVSWFFQHIIGWVIVFILTQLILEINEKYASGIFWDILLGRYIQPQSEMRIVMFLDLKDSTTIAEQLGPKNYFPFIRDFIYYISTAMLDHGAYIYQYVGDEIVVSWPLKPGNPQKCVQAIIAARKNIQKHSEHFRRSYNILPEFKVGIHAGEVVIGEIGVVKKDLAMSGDTMNTAARIRTACNELNQKFMVSRDFIDTIAMDNFQKESMGFIELKGKSDSIELFALKI